MSDYKTFDLERANIVALELASRARQKAKNQEAVALLDKWVAEDVNLSEAELQDQRELIERLTGWRGHIGIFCLERTDDETGVSGTGAVAYGTLYPNGKVTVAWHTRRANSVSIYDNMEDMLAVHVLPHNGKTKVSWLYQLKLSKPKTKDASTQG